MYLTLIFFLPKHTTAFLSASSFNANISKWIVSKVTNMRLSKKSVVLLFLLHTYVQVSFILPFSSSTNTQQPFLVLPRSMPISANGSCRVWWTWLTVGHSLYMYLMSLFCFTCTCIHFTSNSLLPSYTCCKHNIAFGGCLSFNADISKWMVSSVTDMDTSKSFVVLFCFSIHFASNPFLFFIQTQQHFMELPRSTPISASGSCQVWQPCNAVRLSLQIVDDWCPCCFILSISHLTLHLPKHNSLL
jgi:surface protein